MAWKMAHRLSMRTIGAGALLLLSSRQASAQELKANVITTVISRDDCANLLPSFGSGDNLFDGVISDFHCQQGSAVFPSPMIFGAEKSIVTGIRIYANTDPSFIALDPKSYTLEGRVSSNSDWMPISDGQFDDEWTNGGVTGPPPARNTAGEAINSSFSSGDPNKSFGEALFTNTQSYSEYRVTYPTTFASQGIRSAIAELELVGSVVDDDGSPTTSPVLVSY